MPQVCFDSHFVLGLDFQFFLCAWFLPKKMKDSVFQKLSSSVFFISRKRYILIPRKWHVQSPEKEHFNPPKMACLISRKNRFQSPENWSIVISRKLKYFNIPKMRHFKFLKIVRLNLPKLKHCSSSREFPKQNICNKQHVEVIACESVSKSSRTFITVITQIRTFSLNLGTSSKIRISKQQNIPWKDLVKRNRNIKIIIIIIIIIEIF